MYAVGAPEHLKGASPAQEAKGQLLHLADLALVAGHLGVRHPKGGRGIDFIRIKAGAEHVQLGLTGGALGQPRMHTALNGRPIVGDQDMPRLGYQ